MKEIIKYQLISRRKPFLFSLAALLTINGVSWFFGARDLLSNAPQFSGSSVFWLFIAGVFSSVSLIITVLACGSGHLKSLLFKDTGYLLLSLPRRGWQILAGRFIAGLAEAALFFLAFTLCASVHTVLWPILAMSPDTSFWQVYLERLQSLVSLGVVTHAKIALIMICAFTAVGNLLSFAIIATRSFIHRKGLSWISAAVVFIVISNIATSWGQAISQRFSWYLHIDRAPSLMSRNVLPLSGIQQSHSMSALEVPLAPFALYLIIAVLLFIASSWLLDNKVEV